MTGRRKKNEVNKNAWLNTYADMITLILVFFILLYSVSSLDQSKYQMLVKALTADPETIEKIKLIENEKGADKPKVEMGDLESSQLSGIQDLDDLYQYLKGYVKANNLEEAVQVEKGKDNVFIRFTSTLFFEADRAVLKNGGKEILGHVGEALTRVEPLVSLIRIDGHTAEAAPGTSIVDNRELSTDRANAVLKYLEEGFIKDRAKLLAVGYGMFRPVAPNDSEVNRAKNRRVEILISKNAGMQEEMDEFYKKLTEGTGGAE